ncbi:MAG TPA: hypothetical protein VKU42_04580 [Candidatus Angelobacter sp.]|nr:hypothetical protein [Candidatus Angelobacter sp.]
MRSIELHGERRSWNPHLVGRVVRLFYVFYVFLEVWIFRDVRHQFQNFVAHLLTASAAIRKDSVAGEEHGGARLIVMADFVYPGVLDQLSWNQQAICLVKNCIVNILQFHASRWCPFLQLRSRVNFCQLHLAALKSVTACAAEQLSL